MNLGRILLISVHGHAVRIPAEFAIGRWGDGTGSGVAAGAALLERKELFGAEALVVDLRGGFDEVLEVSAEQEVAEVDEFAVVFVFDCFDERRLAGCCFYILPLFSLALLCWCL